MKNKVALMFFIILILFSAPTITTAASVNGESSSINGSFEIDSNGNNLPDFWELVWRNGTSFNPYASLAPYEPMIKKHHYRLYSGTGDKNGYHYVLSDPIPVKAGNTYNLNALLRYTIPEGRATMSIVEGDKTGQNVGEIHYVYKNGGGKWHSKSEQFVTNPTTDFIRIRFEVGGEIGGYLDIDQVSLTPENTPNDLPDINGNFENDSNNNSLPDFWESSWRYGTNQDSYATLIPYTPVGGNNYYRLYNGLDDVNSYQYVISDLIQVKPGTPYQLNAMLRYTLPYGRSAMSIIQIDKAGQNIGETHYVYKNGGWKWHSKNEQFVTKPNADTVRIRFEVGGEVGAYLDVDQVSLLEIDLNKDFENDINLNTLPDFWEAVWHTGSSQYNYATIAQFVPKQGKNHYRLYNGVGDINSYQFTSSKSIPVIGGSAYQFAAWLRYTLPTGYAKLKITQFDSNGAVLDESIQQFNKGNWTWKYKELFFVTRPNATAVKVQFGVGGEEQAYLDIDQIEFKLINTTGNLDFLNKRVQYFYDINGRLSKVLYPNGVVLEYEYDANGNLIKVKKTNN
ncbi:RHS repeat protein [Paenibacillus radicis (ex Gao et al. 2016)]|uniref:CBM-cenC domain-containing protein n=1 Tax=Paenibacillus radicis (ex Gao et al. 2016) TaxID=1737354 RepID=A0A917HPQ4_9BACL|nr:RHS repeat domain-containing protein [Paenibacillus radicis (ex Gao et al. 2016)]GGG86356.1 hypothetical protein GCM10010918_50680 [Paenibacillus radicis (ex Gao et al. 2016)]